MDWKDIATVELPAGAQISDLIAVAGQLQQQARAVVGPRASNPDAPHVRALAEPVQDALEALGETTEALIAAEKRRPAGGESPEKRDTAVANVNADDGWRALAGFLDAARSLPDEAVPGRAEAEALYQRVFGGAGLRFINFRPRRQWETGQRLVAILVEPAVRETLDGLGATRFVKAALAQQREFGLAYGFSQAVAVDTSVTNTRAEQYALQAALRDYVLKVSAQVSARRPESAELARYLLQPYSTLVDELARAPRVTEKTPVAPAPTPADPTK
jgi:hypothetical protein